MTPTAALIPRSDAELAVAEAIRRAADMIEGNVRHAKELGREIWAMPDIRALAPAAALAEVQRLRTERDAALAQVKRLEALLVAEREEVLWNAYYTGYERNGTWDHCCMSDGEWLVRECGFNPADRFYPADAIKAAIPGAARAALPDAGLGTDEEVRE